MLVVDKSVPAAVVGTIQPLTTHAPLHVLFVLQPPARLGQGCVPALIRELLVLGPRNLLGNPRTQLCEHAEDTPATSALFSPSYWGGTQVLAQARLCSTSELILNSKPGS